MKLFIIMIRVILIAVLLCIPLCSTTLSNSSSQLFTFSKSQSFLQLNPEWPLPAIREVTFGFRTDRPHGLLFFQGSISNVKIFPLYELYVMLENGCIKVIHVFGDNSGDHEESFTIGKGLNRDKWHHVTLRINPGTGHLSVRVDNIEKTDSLPSLQLGPSYGISGNEPRTVMYFGGLDPNNHATNQKYNYVRFVGCIGNIHFSHSGNPLFPAKIHLENQLFHGCIDQCKEKNSCLYNGKCINHYTHTSCDCFGTGHEDKICFNSDPVTVTFRGYSYITYRVYDWRDKVHSEAIRISFQFRTFFEDSVLMYASGEHPHRNYVAMSLFGGQLHFEINFGDGPLNCTIGYSLNDELWHTLILKHHGKEVTLQLDSRWHSELEASINHHHLHLDPEIYIGVAPKNAMGLKSNEKFIGCLRNFYFNDKSVLHALYSGENTARYYSMFAVEYGCHLTNVIPMTFPLPESKLVLTMPSNKKLQLSLEFKTVQTNCVLASGEIKSENGIGVWEMLLAKGVATFIINRSSVDDPSFSWTLVDEISQKQLADDQWHQVGVVFDSGEVKLEVDYHHASKKIFTPSLEFLNQMILTTSAKNAERGFIGCMRDIYVAGDWIDPRTVVDTKQVFGKVSLDSCLLVNLCNNPHACEHGGRCYVEKGETYCDCEKTGYTGRTCHFSLYKRTCEELYLVGYRKNGVYKIDIDRNGPHPPAHVYCDMGDESYNRIVTRVENNMQPEMVVRKKGMKSFYFDVTYREFTPEMLQSLVKHSKDCYQHIKYDCFKTPLGLRTLTWMKSSGSKEFITSIGSRSEGCQCGETRTCANSSLLCNCDISDSRWRLDEGNYTSPNHLGITRIYVLQPENLEPKAEGRLTLGALECIETDTQEYVITFKTINSYIEVPGWRRGDIAFSFRTSNSQAVLIYQASMHKTHGYLRVLLINDYQLSFEFTVNSRPKAITVTSRRKLNSGEWQQVWVDHDLHHMRFTVNLDFEMVDFGESNGVGPFEGPLYVGGVPEASSGDSSIKMGFIGCFRGLVINDNVVDLYKHMTRSESAIVYDCQPSCGSNPCQNGATCEENWGSYNCLCVNKFAHTGKNCENNVNTNGMTVVTAKSYYHHKMEGNETHPVLYNDIMLSFRTFEKEGLLLYAFDHFNNFVQLHFAHGNVFFTFNSDRSVYQLQVSAPDLSKGMPVQVKVKRELLQTTLFVNNNSSTGNIIMKFVDRYFRQPWNQGGNLEIIFPPRGTYRTIAHSEIFLGHVGSGTSTNFTKGGFIGCIQGFVINGTIFDLEAAASSFSKADNLEDDENTQADEKFGNLRPGCTMLCDEQPCKNHGLCIENWAINNTQCDCSLTSYTGDVCQKDIGVNFDGITMLMFNFDHEALTLEASSNLAVRLSFSTDVTATSLQVLLFMKFLEKKYILIGIRDDNSLFVEEKIYTSAIRRKVITPASWSDGSRHWFYFSWQNEIIILNVDGKPYTFSKEEEELESYEGTSNIMYIAGFPKSMKTDFSNFEGCISNVIIEFGTLQLMPLETAFGYRKGSLDHIQVHGTVNERKCAAFTYPSPLQATLPSNIPPEIHGPEWYPEPPVTELYKSIFADMTTTSLERISRASSHVAAVMGVLLIIVLLGLLFYLYRLQRRYKRERLGDEYHIYRKGSKRRATSANSVKAVSFSPEDEQISGFVFDAQPLVRLPTTPPPYTTPSVNFRKLSTKPESNGTHISAENIMEMAPLRSTSSQELEWDPAGAQLMSTAMDDMNEDEDPLPELKNQFAPLASASEVTINRLSQTFI